MLMTRRVFGIPLGLVLIVVAVAAVLLIIINAGSIANGLLGAGEDVLEFIFYPDQRVGEVIPCSESAGCQIIQPIVYSLALIFVIVTGFAYTTLLERKLIAYFQQRVGPDRVGPWGLLQPAADGVKLIFKENITPAGANIWVYRIAPMLKSIPTLVVLAVIPMGPPIIVPWFGGVWYEVPLGLADTGVGVLWILAITSLGTYGVALAGWSSNNKYAMLGALRASAQMISYELSMGLTIAVPVLIVGSMSVRDIIDAQQIAVPFLGWFVFQNPLAAAILIIALFAETNRAPFDLPEAEQELTAGYMTEYSGMKFALFMMAEYLGMIAVSMIAISLFFGGYQDGFGLVNAIPILGPVVMLTKVILFLCVFIWVRATLPRIRYDRLMMFGWKVMLPLAIISVIWTAIAVVVGEELGTTGYAVASGVMFVLLLVGGYLVLGRGDAEEAENEDVDLDPVITGERSGIGYAALTLIGGLIAIPILLFNFTISALESLAALGERLADEPEAASEDEATAEDAPALPTQAGD